MNARWLAPFAAALLTACPKEHGAPAASEAGSDAASVAVPLPVDATVAVANEPKDASPPAKSDFALQSYALPDGGAKCARLFGPEEQPFHGPIVPIVRNGELLLITNDGGKAHVERMPIAAPGKDRPVRAPTKEVRTMRWPACEVALDVAYCIADGAVLMRSPLWGGNAREVGRTRRGTKIAAAEMAGGHTAVFFLTEHRTTEGMLGEAFVAVDEMEPMRISEEGSGATQVLAAPVGGQAVVAMLDARLSMTPLHVRTVSLRDGKVSFGKDAVVFVGGAPELGVEMSIATTPSSLTALIPLPTDATQFAMATVNVTLPPHDDHPARWVAYPIGFDPAPTAATVGAENPTVVRLRPEGATPGSKKVLEIGRLDGAGAYTPRDVFPAPGKIAEIRVARDTYGADWIVYGDSARVWLERRLCK